VGSNPTLSVAYSESPTRRCPAVQVSGTVARRLARKGIRVDVLEAHGTGGGTRAHRRGRSIMLRSENGGRDDRIVCTSAAQFGRSCYDPKMPGVTLKNGDGPATYAGASRVDVAKRRTRPVRGDSVRAGDPERWQLGPVQESVANPVRSGRKQRYRQPLCVAGVPSCRR
jgi:hypothetical protein